MKETTNVSELQKQMVDVSDNIVFAQFFTVAGLVMFPACLLGGTWVWYVARHRGITSHEVLLTEPHEHQSRKSRSAPSSSGGVP